MKEKTFSHINNVTDFNWLAIELRRNKKIEEIRMLAKENFITDEQTIERFISGDLFVLASEKMFYAARESGKRKAEEQKTSEKRTALKTGQLELDSFNVDMEISKDSSQTEILDSNSTADGQPDPKTTEDVQSKTDEPSNNKIIADKNGLWRKVQTKLMKELKKYKDRDSRYVVDKLILLSQEDTLLAEKILLPHKSYQKAFAYFFNKSRTVGYKTKVDKSGEAVYLDNDKAVELSVEYFHLDDEAEERKKEELRKKQLEENKKKKMDKKNEEKTETPEVKKQEEKKQEDGQMSIFDMMAS